MVDILNEEFPLGLDVCTDGKNAKCDMYLTDSLNVPWSVYLEKGKYVWCNPPYSDVQPWADKIIAENLPALLLVNAATSANWFHDILKISSEIWVFKGRIAFVDPDTGLPVNGNDRSQMMFVINNSTEQIIKSVDVKNIQPHRKDYADYLRIRSK